MVVLGRFVCCLCFPSDRIFDIHIAGCTDCTQHTTEIELIEEKRLPQTIAFMGASDLHLDCKHYGCKNSRKMNLLKTTLTARMMRDDKTGSDEKSNFVALLQAATNQKWFCDFALVCFLFNQHCIHDGIISQGGASRKRQITEIIWKFSGVLKGPGLLERSPKNRRPTEIMKYRKFLQIKWVKCD